jgi:hypothetical protein
LQLRDQKLLLLASQNLLVGFVGLQDAEVHGLGEDTTSKHNTAAGKGNLSGRKRVQRRSRVSECELYSFDFSVRQKHTILLLLGCGVRRYRPCTLTLGCGVWARVW